MLTEGVDSRRAFVRNFFFEVKIKLKNECYSFFKKVWVCKMTPKKARSSKYRRDGCHWKENSSFYIPYFRCTKYWQNYHGKYAKIHSIIVYLFQIHHFLKKMQQLSPLAIYRSAVAICIYKQMVSFTKYNYLCLRPKMRCLFDTSYICISISTSSTFDSVMT